MAYEKVIGGYSVNIVNYNDFWTWDVQATTGDPSNECVVEMGEVENGSILPITVSGLRSEQYATITAATLRYGYRPEEATFRGRAQYGAPLDPEFDTPVNTEDGFTVNITNYDFDWEWEYSATLGATVSPGEPGGGELPLTVTGAIGRTVVVSAFTARAGYEDGSGERSHKIVGTPPEGPVGAWGAWTDVEGVSTLGDGSTLWTVTSTWADYGYRGTFSASPGTLIRGSTYPLDFENGPAGLAWDEARDWACIESHIAAKTAMMTPWSVGYSVDGDSCPVARGGLYRFSNTDPFPGGAATTHQVARTRTGTGPYLHTLSTLTSVQSTFGVTRISEVLQGIMSAYHSEASSVAYSGGAAGLVEIEGHGEFDFNTESWAARFDSVSILDYTIEVRATGTNYEGGTFGVSAIRDTYTPDTSPDQTGSVLSGSWGSNLLTLTGNGTSSWVDITTLADAETGYGQTNPSLRFFVYDKDMKDGNPTTDLHIAPSETVSTLTSYSNRRALDVGIELRFTVTGPRVKAFIEA